MYYFSYYSGTHDRWIFLIRLCLCQFVFRLILSWWVPKLLFLLHLQMASRMIAFFSQQKILYSHTLKWHGTLAMPLPLIGPMTYKCFPQKPVHFSLDWSMILMEFWDIVWQQALERLTVSWATINNVLAPLSLALTACRTIFLSASSFVLDKHSALKCVAFVIDRYVTTTSFPTISAWLNIFLDKNSVSSSFVLMCVNQRQRHCQGSMPFQGVTVQDLLLRRERYAILEAICKCNRNNNFGTHQLRISRNTNWRRHKRMGKIYLSCVPE